LNDDEKEQDVTKKRLSIKKMVLLFVLVLVVGLGAGVGMNFVLSEPEAKKADKEDGQSKVSEKRQTQPSVSDQSSTSSHARQEKFSVANAMSHVSGLSEHIGPRKAGSVQESSAADYIAARLGEYGYTVEEQPFSMADGFGSRNVLATRSGTREGYTVVIAAHYDSPADSPGAVDNASGVGVALELARIFSTGSSLEPSLQFAFFGGNRPGTVEMEQRLNGSRRYIDLLGSLQKTEIIGMIAIDSVGQGEVLALRTQGTGLQRLRDKLSTFAGEKNIKVTTLKSTDDSDNIPFEDAKVPAVWVEWCDQQGNLNTDNSFASVDAGKMTAAGNLVERFLENLSPENLEELKY
jgi:Zn-dependent M28 family amino/carboxypeptidase